MNKVFYPKLAADNIKKNAKTYIPYIVTCIFTTAMYYIMASLSHNKGLYTLVGADTITETMNLGCIVVSIFAFTFLMYTNSFLMKQRKKFSYNGIKILLWKWPAIMILLGNI